MAGHTVREHAVRYGDHAILAREDETLLAAALRAGLDVPSSCRTGTCRSCMALLERGEVHYIVEWPGLIPEERAQGWILPCVAQPRSDVALELPAV
jgi:ferredoxin